ncbi:neutral zinc metallopeptidase (plasmid) [Mycolicibacterium aichiense]|uniref:neutral zinc metallopeptidase n=1 Tax=Mycolicibacterium aichiense TaxID=1799 RepID=UPI003D667685
MLIVLLVGASLVSACGTAVKGHATSPIFDPGTAGGLPLNHVPSGLRSGVAPPTMTVHGGTGSPADQLATQAVEDIEDYWQATFPKALSGTYRPVKELYSYDSDDPGSPPICGQDTYQEVNAFFCPRGWLIAWDRGVLIPTAQKYFGDMAVPGVLAHEYGHAIQRMANLLDSGATVLMAEQQADCFGGDYLRWVAEGKSPRFTLGTGDGLNRVLAAVITSRDPVQKPLDDPTDAHGTALDRVDAFQMGFTAGAAACAAITTDSIQQRRKDLPQTLQPGAAALIPDGPIDEPTVTALLAQLKSIFSPKAEPAVSYAAAICAGTQSTTPVSYCPSSNTVYIDLPGLKKLGEPGDEFHDFVLLQGSNTAMSALISRYVLAVQNGRGLPATSTQTALRTACLTGAAERQIADSPSPSIPLSSKAIDEAVAGLLANGLAAADATGKTAPAGFNRIGAFRAGLTSTSVDSCFTDFPA